MINLTRITGEGRTWNGMRPVLLEDWDSLKVRGISHLLDLTPGDEPLRFAEQAAKYDITVVFHPLGGFLAPTKEELSRATKFINEHECTYVCCNDGGARTMTVMGAHLLHNKNWPVENVRTLVRVNLKWYHWGWLGKLVKP